MSATPPNIQQNDPNVVDTDDGGAIVKLQEEDSPTASESGFYDNIADDLDPMELDNLGSELDQTIERDINSREDRDKQYAEGIKRTGLGNDAPGGAAFEGASKVVHPMLTKGAVEFGSRCIKELFPPGGPVKDFIFGKSTGEKVDKARRKTAYMNWQCTKQIKELRHDLDQGLPQCSLAGAFYLRSVYDSELERTVTKMIPQDDIVLPYAASSFYTAERMAYVEHITQFEFKRRVASGIYRDVTIIVPSNVPDITKSEQASQKVEGKQPDAINQDGLRDVYEIMVTMDLEEKYGMAPYLISLDKTGREILSVVRNWDQDDKKKEAMYWITEFGFVPWRGAYPIGFIHMIGGLSAAATGSLRALLDSAHANNLPTLLRLKGTNFFGQSTELNPTQITEIEGSIATDDIRKLVMAVPYNPPSLVLFQLLGFLVEEAQGTVTVAMDALTEGSNNNMPVGTALALIEQGMKVLSAVHARLHAALAHFLSILHRINKMYLTDGQVKDDTGEIMVSRADFQGAMDVIPVSDPEIFTDLQRFAQVQLISQRAQLMPQLYDLRKVEETILKRTKIPDAEQLLVPTPTPQEMNAVNENVALVMGRPIAAYPDQDHLAHIQVLLDFMTSPLLGQLPIIAPIFIPGALNHLKDHIALWYVSVVDEATTQAAGEDISNLMSYQDSTTKAELDKTLAVASHKVVQQSAQKAFSALPAIIQNAMQVMQQLQDQMGGQAQDPQGQTKIEVAKIGAASKREALQQRSQEVAQLADQHSKDKQIDVQKTVFVQSAEDKRQQKDQLMSLASEDRVHQAEAERNAVTQSHEDARTAASNETKERINVQDNQTAIDIAAAEIAAGKHAKVQTGSSIGKNGPNP